MKTATASPAAAAALRALIDYAGLFPPARLEMGAALEEYLRARAGAHRWMLGRFILPLSRLPELDEALRKRERAEPLALSLILDAGADPRTWLQRVQSALEHADKMRGDQILHIEALEVPLPPLATRRETYDASVGQFAAALGQSSLATLPAFLEVPRDERWPDLLSGTAFALARHRLGAKIRCGGVTPDAFPSAAEVASFVQAMRSERVPFKATAGLHHPVRHFDAAAGCEMHGFLNLIVACAAAADTSVNELERILAEKDASSFRIVDDTVSWRDRQFSREEIESTRRDVLIAYGSCSFSEPVHDLVELGMIEAA